MTGVNIHGGLRIRLEHDPETRAIKPRYSAETPNTVAADVERYIAEVRQTLGYVEAWLKAWQAQAAEEHIAPLKRSWAEAIDDSIFEAFKKEDHP